MSSIILHSHVTSSCYPWAPLPLALTVGQQFPPLIFSSFGFTAGLQVATIWQFWCFNEKNMCLEPSVWISGQAGQLQWLPALRALAGAQLLLFLLIIKRCHNFSKQEWLLYLWMHNFIYIYNWVEFSCMYISYFKYLFLTWRTYLIAL